MKILFAVILLMLATACAAFVDKALFWRDQRDEMLAWSQKTDTPGAWKKRPVVLFVGDSIIASYPLKAAFSGSCIPINKGVRGDDTTRIALRYRNEIKTTPHDILVMEGGINNIIASVTNGYSDSSTLAGIMDSYRSTIDLANKHGKKVLVIEILPVTNKFLMPYSKQIPLPNSFEVSRVNVLVDHVNSKLRQLCVTERAAFIETHSIVSDSDGSFSRSFATADGYHVNVSGYKILTAAIEPHIGSDKKY